MAGWGWETTEGARSVDGWCAMGVRFGGGGEGGGVGVVLLLLLVGSEDEGELFWSDSAFWELG